MLYKIDKLTAFNHKKRSVFLQHVHLIYGVFNAWRWTVLEEAKGVKKTWAEIKNEAKNRVRLRILV